MSIAIVGGGWSGLLLADALRKKGYSIKVYERSRSLQAICACGIPTQRLHEIARQHDLDAENYIQWTSKQLIIDYKGKQRHVPMKGLCTFNKQQFMSDLQVPVQYGSTLTLKNSVSMVVDATGTREVLGHLATDVIYVTYQVKARFKELPFSDFYMRYPTQDNNIKYLWLFPTSEREAYVGCGALLGITAFEQVNMFLKKYPAEILQKQAKQLRLTPPHQSIPFHLDCPRCDHIVGVGNSIGAVSSFGEGNEPSAVTVQLLMENMTDLSNYQKQVLKKLNWLKHDYAFYKSLTENKRFGFIHMLRMQMIYRKRLQAGFNPFFSVWMVGAKPKMDDIEVGKRKIH